jgi:hypothetical protein
MNIKLKRWQAPSYALGEAPVGRRQDGFTEGPKWHVSEVDADSLSVLCDQFREDVFAKARKVDPRLRQAGGGQ